MRGTILSQCNNFLALSLTNDSDKNVIKRLIPDSLVGLTALLRLLGPGEALPLGDAVLLPTRIRLDQPRVKPDNALETSGKNGATWLQMKRCSRLRLRAYESSQEIID